MKGFLVAAACGILLALTGCSGSFSGTARGLFIGYVTAKTEEEAVAKEGRPESVDTKPHTLRWTHKRKTSKPDNKSPVDEEATWTYHKVPAWNYKASRR